MFLGKPRNVRTNAELKKKWKSTERQKAIAITMTIATMITKMIDHSSNNESDADDNDLIKW